MPNIKLNIFKADVLDRLDNAVQGQQLSEQLRNKLESDQRVVDALNMALILFMHDADAATLQGFQRKVAMTAESENNNVSTYKWPNDAFEERPDGGLVVLVLDGEDQYYDQSHNYPYNSVAALANNEFYKIGGLSKHKVYHVNIPAKRIYTPKDVVLETIIISEPGTIIADANFSQIFYGDKGDELAVTGEVVTADNTSSVALAQSYLIHGSVIVGGNVFYREGIDYEIDYLKGSITVLASGNIPNAQILDIDYRYYDTVSPYLPISSTFRQSLSQLALHEMIKMGQNAPNRQQVMNDTTTGYNRQAEEGQE